MPITGRGCKCHWFGAFRTRFHSVKMRRRMSCKCG